jgi:hypothetical protein
MGFDLRHSRSKLDAISTVLFTPFSDQPGKLPRFRCELSGRRRQPHFRFGHPPSERIDFAFDLGAHRIETLVGRVDPCAELVPSFGELGLEIGTQRLHLVPNQAQCFELRARIVSVALAHRRLSYLAPNISATPRGCRNASAAKLYCP